MSKRPFVAFRYLRLLSAALLALPAALAGRAVAAPPAELPKTAAEFDAARERMVDKEIVGAGIKNRRVIDSLRSTKRHEFIPIGERPKAYVDMALPIGEGQTISPPFMVAFMTEQLDPQADDRVLEIGTGSGYQAAILSPLVRDVYSIEIKQPLGERAKRTLERLGYKNVHLRIGDGYQGWPEAAPFDKIVVTCSPEKPPQALVDQLKEGGRMVIPVGERYQQTLYLFEKRDGQLKSIALLPTLFVPMTGTAEEQRTVQPDPANPSVSNGSFEEAAPAETPPAGEKAAEPRPAGWHYQRQLEWVEDKKAPEGKHFARFVNQDAGRGAQALQGLAIDGRKVHRLELSAWAKGKDIRPGSGKFETAKLFIQFYDDRRAEIGYVMVGPWRGTFDWQHDVEKVDVPIKAREAMIAVGLCGATGELSIDDVQIEIKD